MQPVISSKQAEHATASGQNIGPHSAYPLIAELIRQFGVSPPPLPGQLAVKLIFILS